jgi:bifunctional DNase/RNase
VAHLGLDRATNSPVVILQEKDGERVLPIWIGPAEASAIAMELAGVKFSRPLTHDLLKQVIVGLGADLRRVMITQVKDNTYFAELHLHRDDHVIQLDARPSDSIALALRLSAPIFTRKELLEASSFESVEPSEGPQPLDAEQLKSYLENLDPEDFGKFSPSRDGGGGRGAGGAAAIRGRPGRRVAGRVGGSGDAPLAGGGQLHGVTTAGSAPVGSARATAQALPSRPHRHRRPLHGERRIAGSPISPRPSWPATGRTRSAAQVFDTSSTAPPASPSATWWCAGRGNGGAACSAGELVNGRPHPDLAGFHPPCGAAGCPGAPPPFRWGGRRGRPAIEQRATAWW